MMPAEQSHIMKRMLEGMSLDTKALLIYELVEDNRAIIKPNEMMVRR